MSGLRFLAPMALASVALPAIAEDAGIERAPAPDWVDPSPLLPVPEGATGLLFMRRQDTVVHIGVDGQSTYIGQRAKLLHPQALQAGNVAIAWNPAAGAPMIHTLEIHRGEQTIDVLDQAGFEILRREDQLEMDRITGTLTAVLRVPDLRVGDELELAYTVPSTDPTLRDSAFGLLAVVGAPAPGRYHLGLNWVDGEKPEIRPTGDIAPQIERRANAIDLRLDNPKAMTPPKDAPPRYGWQRVIEYSDFATWNAVSQRFDPLFAKAAALAADSPVREEAAIIAAEHATELERAQAALELVQQQVRYIYVGLNGGNFIPATADETWQRRYGDCKGKTVLLLALLDQLGIDAEPVLVNNSEADDGLDERLPNPALFDHVLVRAAIDGKRYWMDGTLPVVAQASETPAFPYRWALPLRKSGATLEAMPWSPQVHPDELHLYEIDARDGFDAPARISTTTITRGADGLVQYVQLSAVPQDQLLEAFRNKLTGNSMWDDIDDVRYRYDVPHKASILTVSGTGPVDWDGDDEERSLTLPGGGFSPPERRQRASDQDQSAPFYSAPDFDCYVTTVRVPTDSDFTKWGYNSWFDTLIYGRLYYRAFERRDGAIRMIRGFRVEQPEIDRAKAERDNDRLARFDNSMARIFYLPGSDKVALGEGEPVRATYEGDWIASDQACLPGDLRD